MTPARRSPLWHLLHRFVPLALALPMLGGAGICGVVYYDISIRDLILEPVETLRFVSDSGSVEVFAFNRNGISLLYYLTGSENDIRDVGFRLNEDDDELEAFILCDHADFCNANYYAEVPFGTAIAVTADHGGVKLTSVDAAVTADVVGGGFDGVNLRLPSLDLTLESGDVTITQLDPPTAFRITVGEGNVDLTLPAGTYRCQLDAADGTVDTTGITCDPAATSSIEITVGVGDILLTASAP